MKRHGGQSGSQRIVLMPWFANQTGREHPSSASPAFNNLSAESRSAPMAVYVFHQAYHPPSTNISQNQRGVCLQPPLLVVYNILQTFRSPPNYNNLYHATFPSLPFTRFLLTPFGIPAELVRLIELTDTNRLTCQRIPRIHLKDASRPLAGMID